MDTSMPVEVAQHVLWFFGDRTVGVQPGGFVTNLLSAISSADQGNRAKLATAYPEYVQSVAAAQRDSRGLAGLAEFVKAARA